MEVGCNVGNLLYKLRQNNDYKAIGTARDAEAITYARNKVFSDQPNINLQIVDVLSTDFFDTIPSNSISHCFCMSTMILLPNGREKDNLIRELKRISRCLVLYERIATENDTRTKVNRSFQDYEKEYDFRLFRCISKPTAKKEKRIGAYYWTEH